MSHIIDFKSCEKEYRPIWINIQLALSKEKEKGKVVIISSSCPGEGVTTTAINLAKMGALEKRVLLLEANIERPAVSSLLGLSNQNGLIDILTKDLEIEKAIKRKEEMKNLSIITAGQSISYPHYMTLPIWQKLLNQFRESFDITFIDAPPIISAPESAILASLCDGLILVIEADKTRREVIERAQKTIADAKARYLGSILNKRVYKIPKFIYKRL